ncbi:hypothetical protein AO391_01540 [Pseudomonas marginalis ICMP 9505]|nr:hypothetical protein AO391_01540 [Pseudomonas marginalis ICMP 9505]
MPLKTDTPSAYRAAGDLDTSYGNAGYQLINPNGVEHYEAHGLSLTHNNEALIAGAAPSHLPTHTQIQFILMRRDENGAMVEGFGEQGMACGHFNPDEPGWGSHGLKTFALNNSGWLLLGFVHDHANMRMPSFAWLRDDGTADTSHGDNGTFVLKSPLPNELGSHGKPIVNARIQSTGSIVTLYEYVFELNYWGGLLSRIQPAGVLDATFNEGLGYAEALTRGGEVFIPSVLALQADDRILVAGNTDDNRGVKGGLIKRFDKDGRTDVTFAVGGEQRDLDRHYADMVSNEDGILICGSTSQGALLVKLNPDGSPHADFGGLPVITPQVNAWHKVLVYQGNIIALGIIDTGFSALAVLARFDRNGNPDNAFGAAGNGRVLLEFGGQFDTPLDLAIDQQQRILVLGSAKGPIGAVNFYTTRLFY